MSILSGFEPFSHKSGSRVGVLVSQGYTGSTSSVIYWAKKIADAGYDVECPRLTGHGTKWQDLIGVSYKDWVRDLETALLSLRERCDVVFGCGLSMGGALILRLQELNPVFKGLILVNNAMVLNNPLVSLTPILKYILPSTKAISNDIKDPTQKEIGYDRNPTWGVAELARLLKLTRAGLPAVKAPVLIFKSNEDHVLDRENALVTYNEIGSPEKLLVWLDNSYHVATMDFDKDLIVDKTLDFIKKYSGTEKSAEISGVEGSKKEKSSRNAEKLRSGAEVMEKKPAVKPGKSGEKGKKSAAGQVDRIKKNSKNKIIDK